MHSQITLLMHELLPSIEKYLMFISTRTVSYSYNMIFTAQQIWSGWSYGLYHELIKWTRRLRGVLNITHFCNETRTRTLTSETEQHDHIQIKYKNTWQLQNDPWTLEALLTDC